MTGLADLSPPEKRLRIGGREIVLTPVRMGKLAAFSTAAMPVAVMVINGHFLEAVVHHYGDVSAALIIAANVDQAWLDDLIPDDFLRLAEAVVEVNADFFIRRLTPVLLAIQARMRHQVAQITEPSLPILGETDTTSRLS